MPDIGPSQKAALLETFHAAVALSLKISATDSSSTHKMEVVDIAITPSTLHAFFAFFAAALGDPRFKGQLKLGIRLEQRHHHLLRVPHARQRFRACHYGIEGDWEGRRDEGRARRVVVSSTGRPGRAASKPNAV
jgi:hypothetical protein